MFSYEKRTARPPLAVAFIFTAAWGFSAHALDLAQTPLFIPTPLDPNLVVTLDDSGSMAWAYVPDNISGGSSTRRFKVFRVQPTLLQSADRLSACGKRKR